ncbi:hypothetical protein ASPWEDRAFT_648719 [Aspergillus wentii DTO 134E9]|uniref:Uncharacterized protein n=1 Tax=Aspergillus wentii DTO 134E9 TaxID=1073089 RepID=A0A1L9RB00_ASPWE|nr:uncharacterized protein ASPWEDRAFT_648719 [Aspergillus wentii DTO 134E9]OJJ32089.1 hypothetical protein ASPWEDRAFT_648719 [Aspergillus wentii DTO 134E9]
MVFQAVTYVGLLSLGLIRGFPSYARGSGMMGILWSTPLLLTSTLQGSNPGLLSRDVTFPCFNHCIAQSTMYIAKALNAGRQGRLFKTNGWSSGIEHAI